MSEKDLELEPDHLAEGRDPGFETLAIHAGQEPDESTGAVSPAAAPLDDLRPGGRRRPQGLRVQPER